MAKYRDDLTTWGRCDRCRFAGALVKQQIIDPTTTENQTNAVQKVCQTCFNTPTGFKSLNEEHRRLSNEEYAQNQSAK